MKTARITVGAMAMIAAVAIGISFGTVSLRRVAAGGEAAAEAVPRDRRRQRRRQQE